MLKLTFNHKEKERGLDIGGQQADSAMILIGKAKHITYAMPEESYGQFLSVVIIAVIAS